MTSPWQVPVQSFTTIVNLNGSGVGTYRFQNTNPAMMLIVVQISAITTATNSGAKCQVYQQSILVDTMYFIGVGGDSMAGDPPLYLRPTDYIDANISNGNANDTVALTFWFREVPA